jgi:hypothetical protein
MIVISTKGLNVRECQHSACRNSVAGSTRQHYMVVNFEGLMFD